LCNNFKQPTGKPGNTTDRIYCCLAIERRIQRKASAAILGASSGKSSNEDDQGSKDSDDFSFGGRGAYDDEVAAANVLMNDGDVREPVDDNAYEEQSEKANVVARSLALPNFIGGRLAVVTTVAERVDGQGGRGDNQGGGSVNPAPGVSTVNRGREDGQGGGSVRQAPGRSTVPWRSPSSIASSKRGGEQKVKKLH
jgi:hypothetical protein